MWLELSLPVKSDEGWYPSTNVALYRTSRRCDKVSISDETMKALVTDVLVLDSFDEAVMDNQLDSSSAW
jgi:hypothetical protein